MTLRHFERLIRCQACGYWSGCSYTGTPPVPWVVACEVCHNHEPHEPALDMVAPR